MRRRIDLNNGRRYIEDLPDHNGPMELDIVDTETGINSGLIWPAHDEATNSWIEGATQQELDDRAAFVAEQGLIDAARARLQALSAANKSIAGDVELIERGVLLPLGKALVVRSLALRTAATALKTPGATAAEVRTAVINYATAAESAETALLLAIKDIRDAITDREGP